MYMKLPSLKHRKPIVYIPMGIYLFLIVFIIFESSLASGISGVQSNIFAKISAWFINGVTDPVTPAVVNPTKVSNVNDTSYLGKNEDQVSKIAIGTTTLVSISYEYPSKGDNDVYNKEYSLEYPQGERNDYTVSLSSRSNKNTYTVDMRITSQGMNSNLYQINVGIADVKYEYKFHIVPLEVPTSYETKIDKNTLKIGETVKVDTKLIDPNRQDPYLRRYLDEGLIQRSSSNPSVATIDKYGVIHGVSNGTATITFGKYNFDISVSNESIVKPATNSLSLTVDHTSKTSPSLLDYDYVFETGENSNDYCALVYANFSDNSLEDQSISWEVDDNQKVKLAPFKYDNNGYPVYKDDLNRPCVRVSGYRQKGNVTLKAVSNNDNSIYQTLVLNVDEALPTLMTLNITGNQSISVNEQKVITPTYNPKNVNNRRIHVDVSDEKLVSIKNNDSTSVTLTGIKVGNVHVKVTSLANTLLKQEFDFSFTAKDKINEENYENFHQFVRKGIGHFSLFLVTAIFGTLFFYTYNDDKKKTWIYLLVSLGIGIFVAGLSELIQFFIPTRSGLLSDVGIDSLGYLIGELVTFGVIMLIVFIKQKRKKKIESNQP